MTNKIFILAFIIFASVAGIVHAQGTAKATMKVSVKVVSGVRAEVDMRSDLTFNDRRIDGRLGSLTLHGVEGRQIYISNSEHVNLVNESGHHITLPVTMKDEETSDKHNLAFLSHYHSESSEEYSGDYKGHFETTIEYF